MKQSCDDASSTAARLYADCNITLKEIADRVGVSASTVGRWAKARNWRRGRAATRSEDAGEAGMACATPESSEAADVESLVARLSVVIEWTIASLEEQMQRDGSPDAGEREKNARTIATLVRCLDKISELSMERDRQGRGEDGASTSKEEAERLRLALAERIVGLGEELAGRAGSREAQGAQRQANRENPLRLGDLGT
jgi:transcriptional regulator with XRE-family HTH domain